MSVTDDLKAIGGTTEHLDFHQGSFRKGIEDIDGTNIAGGYCSGVVLDWARRVLQSAPDRDEHFMNYSTDKAKDKGSATVSRMALAYKEHAPTYMTGDTNKVKVLALLNELKTHPEESFASYGSGIRVTNDQAMLFKRFWAIPDTTHPADGIFAKFNLSKEPAGVLTYKRIDILIKDLTAEADPQHQARSAEGRHWEGFASQLDTRLTEQRTARGANGAPQKLFSKMKVKKSSPVKDYAEAGYWSAELQNHGFELNCCTILSFSPSAGGTGHAVAVYQKGGDEFIFFDPNYGAFRYSKDQLKKCLQHLFWSPYIKAAKGVLDGEKAVYLRREKLTDKVEDRWDKVGYTIFAVF